MSSLQNRSHANVLASSTTEDSVGAPLAANKVSKAYSVCLSRPHLVSLRSELDAVAVVGLGVGVLDALVMDGVVLGERRGLLLLAALGLGRHLAARRARMAFTRGTSSIASTCAYDQDVLALVREAGLTIRETSVAAGGFLRQVVAEKPL